MIVAVRESEAVQASEAILGASAVILRGRARLERLAGNVGAEVLIAVGAVDMSESPPAFPDALTRHRTFCSRLNVTIDFSGTSAFSPILGLRTRLFVRRTLRDCELASF